MKTTKRKRATPAAAPAAAVADTSAPVETPPAVKEMAGAKTAEPASVVVLPSVCTVKDAAGLKDSLCKVVDETASVTLDVRAVERVDTAVLQLLYAFVRDRSERNLAVAWLGAPSAMLDAALLLGVHTSLKLPEKESIGAAA